MSNRHIARLRRISNELDGARTAIAYVSKNFDKSEIIQETGHSPLSKAFLQEIARNLDETYFVRLTAEFEGILKDHLKSNHPTHRYSIHGGIWKVDDLLSAVWNAEQLRRNPPQRLRLKEVHDYRNSIAHQGQPVAPVTFGEALKRYSKFLDLLPEPRT